MLYLFPPKTECVGPDQSAQSIHYAEPIKLVFSRDGSFSKVEHVQQVARISLRMTKQVTKSGIHHYCKICVHDSLPICIAHNVGFLVGWRIFKSRTCKTGC